MEKKASVMLIALGFVIIAVANTPIPDTEFRLKLIANIAGLGAVIYGSQF